jgi:hypothetical protein
MGMQDAQLTKVFPRRPAPSSNVSGIIRA